MINWKILGLICKSIKVKDQVAINEKVNFLPYYCHPIVGRDFCDCWVICREREREREKKRKRGLDAFWEEEGLADQIVSKGNDFW